MSAQPLVRVRVAGGDDPLTGFILLSLFVHAAGIALIASGLLWPRRTPPPPDPGFFVSLADLPPAGGGSAAVPEPPRPVEPEPPKPAPKPEPVEPPKKKEVLLPEKHTDTPKKAAPAKPSKPEPAAKTPPHPADASTPSGGEGSPGTAGPGVPGGVPGGQGSRVEIPDFEQAWYTALLLTRLKAVWKPPHLPADAIRSVTVSFVIRRNGSVDQVEVVTPSNYEPLNASAIRAVFDAAPLPRLPAQEPRDSVPARMVFEPQPQAP